jgi:hypothetical protein
VKQRWLNEENAVERMDGWMDEENRQGKSVKDDFLLRRKICAQRKRVLNRIDDERKEKGTCAGCSRWSSHTVTNGSKGDRLHRRKWAQGD